MLLFLAGAIAVEAASERMGPFGTSATEEGGGKTQKRRPGAKRRVSLDNGKRM